MQSRTMIKREVAQLWLGASEFAGCLAEFLKLRNKVPIFLYVLSETSSYCLLKEANSLRLLSIQ